MRILVTGGQGQLGVALQRALSEQEVRAPGRGELDVTSAGAVSEAIELFHPEVVIHAAAWTDTAAAERDPAAALAVNGEGSGNVAVACAAAGIPVAYVSSNEVFDGEKGAPYDEVQTRPEQFLDVGPFRPTASVGKNPSLAGTGKGQARSYRTGWLHLCHRR